MSGVIPAHSAAGLRCPLCAAPLMPLPGTLRCPAGHCFDLAKEGYANLLPVQKKRTKDPGDSREMVEARRRFLQAGFYAPFAAEAARLCLQYARPGVHVVDAGCGEGYYDAAVWQALEAAGLDPALVGFDIARPAVRLAAKLVPGAAYAVAGSFAAPVKTGWADVILNIFSPLAREEFLRMLRPGGVLIYAVPTPRHLFGLKQVLYATPYENPEQQVAYEGFAPLAESAVADTVTVPVPLVEDLFSMTPYYWKTPREGAEKLAALPELTTEIGFRFLVLQKQ